MEHLSDVTVIILKNYRIYISNKAIAAHKNSNIEYEIIF